ncbi:MAG: 6-phosphogluconolactonase [Cytophagaceae bacterium]|nr:MAG: 6-phosphogluconolactonase [Cytophagaceae bacterium]
MQLIIKKNPADLAKAAADFIAKRIKEVLKTQDRFTIALSGGSTPKALHELLAKAPYVDQIPWLQLHVFWGDERYVPATDKESNYRMAKETLLQPLNISPQQVFPVDTGLSPEAAAKAYQANLERFFDEGEIRFDLILLGMGDDAHTASLFPYSAILHDSEAAVRAVELPEKQTWRITMNAPMINNAARIIFLVTGPEKAEALKHVMNEDPEGLIIDLYPAQLIRNERVAWFVDRAAAQRIEY